MQKSRAVLGIFKSRFEVEKAVDELKADGFSSDDISVLMSEVSGSHEFAHTKGTKAPEGAATGAGTGAVIGGTLGLLVGIGALAIPGVGPFIAAGPIMGALAGVGVGGAVGGITGALIGLGIPEYEAKRYEGFVKDGGILLSVHTDTTDEVKKAKECLVHCGAHDISSTSETKGEDRDQTYRSNERSGDSMMSTGSMVSGSSMTSPNSMSGFKP